MEEGIITFKKEFKKGTDIIGFKLSGGETAKTYAVRGFRNYVVWESVKVGDHVEGLRWKDKSKGHIDADSQVVRI